MRDAVVVRVTSEGPSPEAIVVAADSFGVVVGVPKEQPESLSETLLTLYCLPEISEIILKLAMTWHAAFTSVKKAVDESAARGEEPMFLPDDDDDDDDELSYDIHPLGDGGVHLVFDRAVTDIEMDAEEAIRFAEDVRAAAARAVAEGAADGSSGSGGAEA